MKWTGNRFCWGDPKCSTYTTYSAVASTRKFYNKLYLAIHILHVLCENILSNTL